MKRLTVHLKNVEKVNTDVETQTILSGMKKDSIVKHYLSNIN